MKLETFFHNFELLIDAPNAVAKLREIILQLAARGKLVHQDKYDEPASILISQIINQRNTLISQGEIKEEKALQSVGDEELVHPIPFNWIWTRLGEVVNYSGAKKLLPNELSENVWLLDLEDIEKDTSRIIARKNYGEKNSKSTKAKFSPGDVLYGKLRPYLNKVIVADSDGYCTTEIVPLKPYQGVIPEYVMYILKRPDFLSYANSKTYGINLPRLGTDDGRKAVFPLAPTREQKRIVEKCDRLLSLCNQIEVRQQQKQESIVRMNESAIAQLLSSQNPEEFHQHWQRVCDNFDLLYSIPETIPKLRQAILQLAVQGKLVRQEPNDEPASVFLARIELERNSLLKAKKIKRIDTLPVNGFTQFAYQLPEQWSWIRLGNLVQKLGAGSTPLGGKNVYATSGIKFLRSQNVWNDGLRLDEVVYITPEIHKKMSGTVVNPGDILLNITGASIGRCAVVPEDFDEGNVSQHVSIIRLIDKGICYYIHTCIISSLIQDQIMEVQVGISREGLSMTRLKDFLIPLPPLAEQKRIVTKVNRLMSFCDNLEAKLKEARAHSEKLMEVAAKQILTA